MFTVLYRWKIRTGFEQDFVDAWSEVTLFIKNNYGSLGSRLHRGDDGIFYAYARWQSESQRTKAFAEMPESAASKKMKNAIESKLPEVKLIVLSDHLK